MSSYTRRAFLSVPLLAIGALNLSYAAAGDDAPEVLIVEFTEAGKRGQAVRVPKILKPEAEWRKQLSRIAFEVTRHGGTESAFTGAYWNLHDKGLFRCVCCDT